MAVLLTALAATAVVAAESGWVAVPDLRGRRLTVTGRARLADDAHVVAIDPATHRSYYPLAHGTGDQPELLTEAPP